MKKNILLFTYILMLGATIKAQPWYGQLNFTHSGIQLSSAQMTYSNSGYIIAGYNHSGGVGAPTFVIDKVDLAGGFNTATDFSLNYYLATGGTLCSTPSLVTNFSGVSIIETANHGNGENYAIAGAWDEGVLFATLDASGNILRSTYWQFTMKSFGNTYKPSIRESKANPGNYYICGNENGQSYIIKVDFNLFSPFASWYSSTWTTHARDLIESPYNSAELIVVGRLDDVGPTAADAFFVKLNSNNGAIISAMAYNFLSWDSDDWFSCIEEAKSPTGGNGYILGGRAHGPTAVPPTTLNNVSYTQWMCKLDQVGNVVWSTLIQPTAHTYTANAGSEITRVYERFNFNTGSYEYYGAAGSVYGIDPSSGNSIPASNMVVFKLDDNGTKGALSPTEFHYTGGVATFYANLTGFETPGGGGPDDGIHVYGNRGGNGHYMVKSYFNGVSGCNDTLVDIDSLATGPLFSTFPAFTPAGPMLQCPALNISTSASPTVNSLCYASSISSGSNAKTNTITGIEKNKIIGNKVTVFPDPIIDKTSISIPKGIKSAITVLVYSSTGQLVMSKEFIQGETDFELNFASNNLSKGLYTISIYSDTFIDTQKVIFIGNN